MNDQTAQDQQQLSTSYVDDYVPPTDDVNLSEVPLDDSSDDVLVTSQNDEENKMEDSLEGIDDSSSDQGDFSDEDIETQNIFFMLGVEDGDDELKEKFLDQLQDVIWDDFLSNDVSLLLNQEEMTQFNTYKEKVDSTTGDNQELEKDNLVEFLEKLIPDLEDIMLEKALDLKADLFVERINGMKEYFADQAEQLAEINQAEQFMFDDKWKSAASTLNKINE